MSTPRKPFFERLKAALEEGIRHARGEIELRTTILVDAPPALTARDIARLRETLQVSRAEFAQMLNVSLKTVQSWEEGERKPTQAALRLLQVIGSKPEAVCQVTGVPFPSRENGQTRPRRKRRSRVVSK